MRFKTKFILMFGVVLLLAFILLGILFALYIKADSAYSEARTKEKCEPIFKIPCQVDSGNNKK